MVFRLTHIVAFLIFSSCLFETTHAQYGGFGMAGAGSSQNQFSKTTVAGQVVDAETGEPVKEFKLVPGTYSFNGQINWQPGIPVKTEDGKFEEEASELFNVMGWIFRVEALDYEVGKSSPLSAKNESHTVSFSLKKEPWTRGVVHSQDGKPVSGVDVHIYTKDGVTLMQDVAESEATLVQTDDKGEFAFPPKGEEFEILAVHDDGFVHLKESDSPRFDLVLQPYGTVKGKLIDGGKPVSGGAVMLQLTQMDRQYASMFQRPNYYMEMQANTDEQGNFVFDKVIAGEATISHEIVFTDHPLGFPSSVNQSRFLEIEPGETVEINVGGAGRTVVGKLVVPDDAEVDFGNGSYRISKEQEAIDLTKFSKTMPQTNKEIEDLYNALLASEEYQKNRQGVHQILMDVKEDGTFEINDIPPGEYSISIVIVPEKINVFQIGPENFKPVVNMRYPLTVPAAITGNQNEPLNAGDIELIVKHEIIPGAKAPDFEQVSLDGKTIRLSDYRGKVVLLDFWATWCTPCIFEFPNIKKMYEDLSSNPNFAIIGLSLDDHESDFREFVNTKNVEWAQCFLEGKWDSKLAQKYSVDSLPNMILVGADGTILKTGLRGPMVRIEVEKALNALKQ